MAAQADFPTTNESTFFPPAIVERQSPRLKSNTLSSGFFLPFEPCTVAKLKVAQLLASGYRLLYVARQTAQHARCRR